MNKIFQILCLSLLSITFTVSIKVHKSFRKYKPNSKHKVEGLFLLFRHGARTASRFPDPIFMKLGTPKLSQLTKIGKHQIRHLASNIIKKYGNQIPNDVAFVISPSRRCRDSFWEFFEVFNQSKPLLDSSIFFVEPENDIMFHAKTFVKSKHIINEKIYEDPQYEKQIERLKIIVDRLNSDQRVQDSFHHYCTCCNNATFTNQIINYRYFYSYFVSLYHNNLKKFEVNYDTLALTKKVFYVMTYLIDNYPIKFTKLMANEFINYLGNQALAIVKHNWAYSHLKKHYKNTFESIYSLEHIKFSFFSGHDHNIIPLLFLFLLKKEKDLSFLVKHPEFEVKFASYLSVEYYSIRDSETDEENIGFKHHHVFAKIIFNDQVIRLKACGYKNCELQEFLELISGFKHECNTLECVKSLSVDDFFNDNQK